MTNQNISFEETKCFSELFLNYCKNSDELQPFFNLPPSIESFKNLIENYEPIDRQLLADTLNKQYSDLTISDSVKRNIELLRDEKTFTITTGHQLQIFTGPLFFIYKIVSTITTCTVLKKHYPDYNFVPVFWMASEDHDFEEINHFTLFHQTYNWETNQTGAVGGMKTTGFESIIDQIKDMPDLFRKAYNGQSLSAATREITNSLFEDYGLVILDAHDRELKASFKEILREELFECSAEKIVNTTSAGLEKLNYKQQVTPREINLFYLKDGVRERIVKEGSKWKVNNTSTVFDEQQINSLLEKETEVFSPNVILRPVYQQKILPNISYIGGPGEIAYWLQLKDLFDHYKITYPILQPRNFALVVNTGNQKKLQKVGVTIEQLFQKSDDLRLELIDTFGDQNYDLSERKPELTSVYDKITEAAKQIDPTLESFIQAELQRNLKQFDNIEKKLRKSEERKQQEKIDQVLNLQSKLFPNGGLQERNDNFLNFYINNPDFITQLLDTFEPLNLKFNILYE